MRLGAKEDHRLIGAVANLRGEFAIDAAIVVARLDEVDVDPPTREAQKKPRPSPRLAFRGAHGVPRSASRGLGYRLEVEVGLELEVLQNARQPQREAGIRGQQIIAALELHQRQKHEHGPEPDETEAKKGTFYFFGEGGLAAAKK